MKVAFGALTLISVIGPSIAYAVPVQCSNCVGAPGPEIGDGLVGVTVAAVLVFAVLALPRLKRWMKTKTV